MTPINRRTKSITGQPMESGDANSNARTTALDLSRPECTNAKVLGTPLARIKSHLTVDTPGYLMRNDLYSLVSGYWLGILKVDNMHLFVFIYRLLQTLL